MRNSVIAKNEPKNSNVKMFKNPKKIKESEYSEPKIFWNKTKNIYVYVITQQRNIEKYELLSEEKFVDIVVKIC